MCQHQNIIKLVDLFENNDNYFIVLDFLPGKDLFDYIIKEFAPGHKINYNTFLSIMSSCQGYSNFEGRIERAFNMLDESKTGKITSENIKNVFEKLNVNPESEIKSWEELIAENDKDKKGYLTLDDFKKSMMFYVTE